MIYQLHYGKMLDDFIEIPADAFGEIILPCMASEFQKISKKAITITASEAEGGLIFPDFIYDDAVPLFSEKLFAEMRKVGTEHLLCINVNITDNIQKITMPYILGLPPRIRVTNDFGSIDEAKAGNYPIFKSSVMKDNTIYITESMYQAMASCKPIGMEFFKNDVP